MRLRASLTPLGHELPREVHRHRVLEHDGDHRQPELRDRAHFLRARHAHQRRLDRIRDALLDLGRGQAGRLRDDDDLVVREVGKGLDRQVAPRDRRPSGRARRRRRARTPLPQGRRREAFDESQALTTRLPGEAEQLRLEQERAADDHPLASGHAAADFDRARRARHRSRRHGPRTGRRRPGRTRRVARRCPARRPTGTWTIGAAAAPSSWHAREHPGLQAAVGVAHVAPHHHASRAPG